MKNETRINESNINVENHLPDVTNTVSEKSTSMMIKFSEKNTLILNYSHFFIKWNKKLNLKKGGNTLSSTKYKKISILLGMILLLFTFTFPSDIKANSNTSAQQVVNDFYEAIVKQNFGIAAEYYSLPIIGGESPYSQYKNIQSTADYFDYLYPQENYTLIEYEVVSIEEVDKENFHANIRLRGEGSTNPDGFDFYQDVLVTLGKDNDWKLSIEGYVKYIQSISLTKSVEELSERDLIFRFFNEMEKGNYGVAAEMASPEMSTLKSDTIHSISTYLKEWNSDQQESDERITPERLYILNELPLQDDKTLYLISSNPYRNDKRLKASLSLFENNETSSNPDYQFVQLDHIDGRTLINLSDGNKSYDNAIASGDKQEKKSTGETNALSAAMSKTIIVLSIILFILVISYFGISLLTRQDNDRTNSTSPRVRNTYRDSNQVDIEESVEQLLTRYENNSNEEEIDIDETLLPSKNQTRQIHISSVEIDDNPITFTPSNSKRKIHTDDD
ncbi:hypothetical protein [Sporosarcina sp. FSL K6-1508]|uniref:hypothetical protein n=1 Tax=Sporosarcina sp. FSL K6-1508 TaxID=2921553 RepID=UPI0030F6EE75